MAKIRNPFIIINGSGGGTSNLSCFTYIGSFTPASVTTTAPDITVPNTAKAIIIAETKTHDAYIGGNIYGVLHLIPFNGTTPLTAWDYGIASWDNKIYSYNPTGITISASGDNLVVQVTVAGNARFYAGHTYEYGYMEW